MNKVVGRGDRRRLVRMEILEGGSLGLARGRFKRIQGVYGGEHS